MHKETGGPAYPTLHTVGMTLRDVFAKDCMAAMIVRGELPKDGEELFGLTMARAAYAMADAMLQARKE